MRTKMRRKWYTNVQGVPLPNYNNLMLVHTTTKLKRYRAINQKKYFHRSMILVIGLHDVELLEQGA